MTPDILKLLFQLIILGILGGGVSWFYSKIQKNRELRIQLIRDFARIQGDFLQLRYEYNTFHVIWNNGHLMEVARSLSDEELRKIKWSKYEQACDLIGEYQSLKPLLIEFFPKTEQELNEINQTFQVWRRRIRENAPIFQTVKGSTESRLKKHKSQYNEVITLMRKKI